MCDVFVCKRCRGAHEGAEVSLLCVCLFEGQRSNKWNMKE